MQAKSLNRRLCTKMHRHWTSLTECGSRHFYYIRKIGCCLSTYWTLFANRNVTSKKKTCHDLNRFLPQFFLGTQSLLNRFNLGHKCPMIKQFILWRQEEFTFRINQLSFLFLPAHFQSRYPTHLSASNTIKLCSCLEA